MLSDSKKIEAGLDLDPLNEATDGRGLWARMMSCASLEDIQHNIISPLCCLLDAESGVYVPYRIDDDVLGEGICCGANVDSLIDYKQKQYHKVDPITSACKKIARNHFDATTSRYAPYPITQLCELMDPKVFNKTEYYNDFLKRFDIQEVLAVAVPLQSLHREVLVIGFHRPSGAKPFSLNNIEFLAMFGLHVVNDLKLISASWRLILLRFQIISSIPNS